MVYLCLFFFIIKPTKYVTQKIEIVSNIFAIVDICEIKKLCLFLCRQSYEISQEAVKFFGILSLLTIGTYK